MKLLLLFFFFCCLAGVAQGEWFWQVFGYACPFTRQDAVACLKAHVDTNHDGRITAEELQRAIDQYGGTLLWTVFSWKKDQVMKSVMHDCHLPEHRHRHYLTADDFLGTAKSCLPTPFDMCMLKRVCDTASAAAAKG